MANETIEEKFIKFFKSEKYRELIARAAATNEKSIPIDFNDIIAYDKEFSHELVEKPLKYLPLLDFAAYKQLEIEAPEYASQIKDFHVRITNLPIITPLREIRSAHLRKLIMVDGIVVRATNVRPLLKKGVFRCSVCGALMEIEQASSLKIEIPKRCRNPACKASGSKLVLDYENSDYIDYQVIGLQEKPEDLPPGQLPRVIEVRLKDDLVDKARPGDRVIVVGVLSSTQEKATQTTLRVFKPYIEANNIETLAKEPETIQITPEEEKMFLEMASDPFIHKKIIDSIAPSIYGLEHIKEAIMLLLFGGRTKVFPDNVRVRGDINILLIGDPGTAKSVLLQYVARIAPRGLYTSGRGSTAAGLTAAVLREKAGGMVLEAGALVLADKGVCCIDEIDKMRPEDRVAIHEAMATQTISIAKGGIVATLNARTAILAAANPALGRYDPYRQFIENINLPITILSRFDLIFVLRDVPEIEQDKKVASHLITLHATGAPKVSPPIPPEILKKYIAYAKRIEPILSEEALKVLEDFYLKMRKSYEETSTVAITARQLESLIRLTEARARVALRKIATAEDAGAVVLLMKKSLSEVGIDIETGKMDIDVLMTGKPKSVRDKIVMVMDKIKEIEEKEGIVEEDVLRDELKKDGLTDIEITRILNQLITDGRIYSPKPRMYKMA